MILHRVRITGEHINITYDTEHWPAREIPATSLRAGPSLRLKNGYGQDDFYGEQSKVRDCGALVRGLVVAGLAAVLAIHQAVVANADVGHGLAEAAKLFAITRTFRLVALGTTIFRRTGSGAHQNNVAGLCGRRK